MITALVIYKLNTTSLATFSDYNCKKKKLLRISKKVKILTNNKISETKTKVEIRLNNGMTIKKTHDLRGKMSKSLLEQKLYFKSKSLLGKKIANKLWLDPFLDNTLPSNWMQKNGI